MTGSQRVYRSVHIIETTTVGYWCEIHTGKQFTVYISRHLGLLVVNKAKTSRSRLEGSKPRKRPQFLVLKKNVITNNHNTSLKLIETSTDSDKHWPYLIDGAD